MGQALSPRHIRRLILPDPMRGRQVRGEHGHNWEIRNQKWVRRPTSRLSGGGVREKQKNIDFEPQMARITRIKIDSIRVHLRNPRFIFCFAIDMPRQIFTNFVIFSALSVSLR
jgi:hypothetical protein